MEENRNEKALHILLYMCVQKGIDFEIMDVIADSLNKTKLNSQQEKLAVEGELLFKNAFSNKW